MIKKVIILILIILIVAFLESNYPKFLKLFGIAPNLLLIFVVFFNIYFRQKNALLFTALCGIVKDVFSLTGLGTNIFSLIICGIVVNKIKITIYHSDRLSQVLIVLLVSLLNSFIFFELNLFSSNLSFFKSLFFIMLPEGLYTAAMAPLIFYGLKRCGLKFSV